MARFIDRNHNALDNFAGRLATHSERSRKRLLARGYCRSPQRCRAGFDWEAAEISCQRPPRSRISRRPGRRGIAGSKPRGPGRGARPASRTGQPISIATTGGRATGITAPRRFRGSATARSDTRRAVRAASGRPIRTPHQSSPAGMPGPGCGCEAFQAAGDIAEPWASDEAFLLDPRCAEQRCQVQRCRFGVQASPASILTRNRSDAPRLAPRRSCRHWVRSCRRVSAGRTAAPPMPQHRATSPPGRLLRRLQPRSPPSRPPTRPREDDADAATGGFAMPFAVSAVPASPTTPLRRSASTLVPPTLRTNGLVAGKSICLAFPPRPSPRAVVTGRDADRNANHCRRPKPRVDRLPRRVGPIRR